MFNLIIGLTHTGSQITSQGSETRNLWTYNGITKLSIIPFTYIIPCKPMCPGPGPGPSSVQALSEKAIKL